MKKTLLSAASVAVIGMALAPAAFAADGTITFNGQISDSTCDVKGGAGTNGSAKDFTVTLPTVQSSALKVAEDRAGSQPFEVLLSGANCTDGKVAKLWWETAQSPNIDAATGRLKNSAAAGAATNVQVGLRNNANAAINLYQNTNPSTATITNNEATLNYTAEYVATGGAATAGTVTTNVVYSVAYN